MQSSPAVTAGDNDVTVIFKPVPGAKRWQPLARQRAGQGRPDVPAAAPPAAVAAAPAGFGGQQAALTVESNYTVILGSHRNSCLKFEKNGETKQLVSVSSLGARQLCGAAVLLGTTCIPGYTDTLSVD